MTTQALYNKWRGQTFDDILGQEHITRTLRNQIRAGRIGHAYLFTGVRGTGKTSTARILAKAINCVGNTDDPPCNKCPICNHITSGTSLDLIEVDAASNRGIDEIRDLRDKVNFSPSESRYKVYVIDEVHMLTREAFNALLKTLEEPPNHAVFVLCTTEPHRLPDTVLSRCQRFDFKRGTVQTIAANLEHICAEEGIAIAPDALAFVARRAGGSFRDAVSLLDQLAAYGSATITLDQVQQILGTVPSEQITNLLRSMFGGDLATGLRAVDQALDQGAEPVQFLADILEQLRALMLIKVGSGDGLARFSAQTLADLQSLAADASISLGTVVRTIKLYSDSMRAVRNAARPQLAIEIALVEAVVGTDAGPDATGEPSSSPETAQRPAPALTDEAPRPAPSAPPPVAEPAHTAQTGSGPDPQPTTDSVGEPAADSAPEPAYVPQADAAPSQAVAESSPAEAATATPVLTLDWVRAKWRMVRSRVRALDISTAGFVNSTRPMEVHGNTLRLACNSFVCEKLSDPKRRSVLETVLSEVLGTQVIAECVACDPSQTQPPDDDEPPQPQELFPPGDKDTAGDTLLNHPAVRELRRRGGQITQVNTGDQQEERRGQ